MGRRHGGKCGGYVEERELERVLLARLRPVVLADDVMVVGVTVKFLYRLLIKQLRTWTP